MDQRKKDWLTVVGLLLFVLAMVACVKLIFAGLGVMIGNETDTGPQRTPLTSQDGMEQVVTMGYVSAQQDIIEQWLEGAEQETACYLACEDTQEGILYLPMQDLEVGAKDMTATMEETDGKKTLVLRIRTPEGSDPIDPLAQIMTLQSQEDWDLLSIEVILDGRTLELSKMVYRDGTFWEPSL